jgi:hypothetical protein
MDLLVVQGHLVHRAQLVHKALLVTLDQLALQLDILGRLAIQAVKE